MLFVRLTSYICFYEDTLGCISKANRNPVSAITTAGMQLQCSSKHSDPVAKTLGAYFYIGPYLFWAWIGSFVKAKKRLEAVTAECTSVNMIKLICSS